ncbi:MULTISPECIES: DUF3597 domain-containing protein [Rhodomicrobium]|uniref:DUF3597 domain-containing protein n=1 Tax=Rhodomicrobium TaxID=1068 RepID=UPI000B4A8EF2|nr:MULTISPECIES: DUF3597 domain-containing protein [Rhodomicrobium]
MSIFGKIASSIFGSGEGHAAEAEPVAAGGIPPTPATKGAAPAAPAAAPRSVAATAAAWAFGGKDNQTVDVAVVLDKLTLSAGAQQLQWRTSIVDMMKLLKLDSSLAARKALADELKYPGDKNDSATMNIWLHKQVMTKLAENGGVVPKELVHKA